MAFDIHTSHRTILLLPLGIYVLLVLVVAWLPAERLNRAYPADGQVAGARPGASGVFGDPSLVARGEQVFKAWNCAVCHTQQIRGDERVRVQVGDRWMVPVRAPDARFGLDEPTDPAYYANASPPMLGTQRTGPDLLGVGDRLPSPSWHYWHLYDPRAVSPDSVMPSYRELFRVVPKDGPVPPDDPVSSPVGFLVVLIVVVLFAGAGWLLFGWTPTLLVTAALGFGAGWLILKECQLCQPPPEQGEVVEDEIDALGLPAGTQLVASPDARALVEYLLSLRRPARRS